MRAVGDQQRQRRSGWNVDGLICRRAVVLVLLAGGLDPGVERSFEGRFNSPDGNVVKVEAVCALALQGWNEEVIAGYRGEYWLN